jgi:hypothetical protein
MATTKFYLDKLDDKNEIPINDEGDMASYKTNEVYNVFWDNQVLTASQLNKVVERLEEEDRLSRTQLVGSGIIQGFKVNYEEGELVITSGLGITTDGDLVMSPKINEFAGENGTLAEIKLNTFTDFDDKCNYFNTELAQKLSYKQNSGFEYDIADKILVLYLESYDKEPGVCDEENCDNQGPSRLENFHFLLFDEEQLQKLFEEDHLSSQQNKLKSGLKQIANLKPEKVSILETDTSYTNLVNQYNQAIENGLQIINNAVEQWNTLDPLGKPLLKVELSLIFDANIKPVQQYYLHLKYLMDAFNELIEHTTVHSFYPADSSSFPKHLLLGKVSDMSTKRHAFYPAMPFVAQKNGLDKLEFMVNRFNAMVTSFNFSEEDISNNNQITTVTPSKQLRASLSSKAIPYMYNPNLLHKYWDFYKSRYGKETNYLHFNRSQTATQEFYKSPLKYNHDQHDFYLIEGHLGQSEDKVLTQLRNTIRSEHLPIKILSFDLGEDAIKTFLNTHHGLEHTGGTRRDGTFILLYKNGKVVADFSLPYRVYVHKDKRDVVTASYPWISTLKYINNLSRTYNNPKQINAPSHYTLKISKYRISGHNLLSSPSKRIKIKIEDLYYRRLHAVAEKLNSTFPKGLVFDYDEARKRMNITRMRGHEFSFRVEDVTFENENENQYTFTNNRVYFNGKPFTYGKVIERFYDSNEYSTLHENYAPVNKDDDYGSYHLKWAEWNRLIQDLKVVYDDRELTSIQKIEDSHSSRLRSNLRKLISQIKNQNPQANIELVGDFLNGSWVSFEMLRNPNSTVRDFLNLREFLHHKTGASDLSVIVSRVSNSFSIKSVKEKLDFNVNILIDNKTGQNATNITDFE